MATTPGGREITPRSSETRIDVETPWRHWSSVPVPLAGKHQAANAALAVGLVELVSSRVRPVPAEAVFAGLSGLKWPARIEVVMQRPTVVIDAAHNWAAASALLSTVRSDFPARRRVLVFAGTRDKDVRGLLRLLAPAFDTVVLTQYQNNPRVVPLEQLYSLAQSVTDAPVHLASDPAAAWKLAGRLATAEDLVCITGSFFLAAEMRELIVGEACRETDARCGAGQTHCPSLR
jgi:dihydrofolate synthase / folylpolyglutamate synthase